MSVSIPSKEPASIVAGMTAKWSRTVSGYSAADGWALKYVLRDRAGTADNITFTGTADGSGWLVTLAAATTADYTAAVYEWTAYVELDGEKYIAHQGVLEIEPDPTGASADSRSRARRVLDLLETASETLASKTVDSTSVNGRTYTLRDREQLRADIGYWRGRVQEEDARARRKRGQASSDSVRVRFTPTSS